MTNPIDNFMVWTQFGRIMLDCSSPQCDDEFGTIEAVGKHGGWPTIAEINSVITHHINTCHV